MSITLGEAIYYTFCLLIAVYILIPDPKIVTLIDARHRPRQMTVWEFVLYTVIPAILFYLIAWVFRVYL